MFSMAIREIPVGIKFKVKVNYCNMNSRPYEYGMRDNQVFIATKVTPDNVMVHLPSGFNIYLNESDSDCTEWSLRLNKE